jgi:hypothetical protein
MTHECIFRGRVHIRWPTHMYKRKTKWVRVRTASWLAPNHNTNKSDHRRKALARIKIMLRDRNGTQMHLRIYSSHAYIRVGAKDTWEIDAWVVGRSRVTG